MKTKSDVLMHLSKLTGKYVSITMSMRTAVFSTEVATYKDALYEIQLGDAVVGILTESAYKDQTLICWVLNHNGVYGCMRLTVEEALSAKELK